MPIHPYSRKSLYEQHYAVTVVAEDRDGIATAQQRVGAGVLVLDGALTSGGVYTAADSSTAKVGHQVSAYSAGNISTVVFTIVGTDPDGYALSETVTGVSNSTVETTNYFYTVTSVSSSATVGSDVEIGIVDEIQTQVVPIEARASGYKVGLGSKITGTVSVTAVVTMDDLASSTPPVFIADTTFATKTATFYSDLNVLVTAVALRTNSYSSGATFTFDVLQNK